MKKFAALMVFVIVLGFAGMAFSDSTFNVKDTYGVYLSDGSTLVPVGYLVQLVWSSDSNYAGAVEGLLDDAGYGTYGDYILYQDYTTQLGGWGSDDFDGTTNYVSTDVGGNPLPSGYAYVRVFDCTGPSPTAGTWFVQSSLVPVQNDQTHSPPDTPDVVDIAPTAGSGTMNQQVSAVPEPASVAMFGVGAVAVLFWRGRRGN